jgi:hypothetical protein
VLAEPVSPVTELLCPAGWELVAGSSADVALAAGGARPQTLQ